MIRVLVSFFVQRAVLLVVALAAVNFSGQTTVMGDDMLPNIRSDATVWPKLLQKISKAPEMATLKRAMPLSSWSMIHAVHSPYIWLCKWFSQLTRLSPVWALILLSNFFFLWFLLDSHQLLIRMVTDEMAAAVGTLLVFWPASYEMSLGSELALTCLLVVRSVRASMDDNWWSAGVSMALLALVEPVVLGLLPLVIYLFWYFHRSQPAQRVLISAVFLLVPPAAALAWRFQSYGDLRAVFAGSALFNLASSFKTSSFAWTFSHSYLGQTITLVIFLLGTVSAVINGAVWLHRLIPMVMLLVLVAFSPYTQVASRAPMAGVCLTGIVGVGAPLTRLIQIVFFSLGAQEVFALFS
jgi:hypothetical protein